MVEYILYNNEYENINKNFFNKNGEIMKKTQETPREKLYLQRGSCFISRATMIPP